MTQTVRRSGVLLHPTSLPGPYGVGSFNQDAYRWVDFLASTHQTLWQVLPLGLLATATAPIKVSALLLATPL